MCSFQTGQWASVERIATALRGSGLRVRPALCLRRAPAPHCRAPQLCSAVPSGGLVIEYVGEVMALRNFLASAESVPRHRTLAFAAPPVHRRRAAARRSCCCVMLDGVDVVDASAKGGCAGCAWHSFASRAHRRQPRAFHQPQLRADVPPRAVCDVVHRPCVSGAHVRAVGGWSPESCGSVWWRHRCVRRTRVLE